MNLTNLRGFVFSWLTLPSPRSGGPAPELGRDIYQDLLQYRKFPDDVFIATDPNLGWLRAAIEQPPE